MIFQIFFKHSITEHIFVFTFEIVDAKIFQNVSPTDIIRIIENFDCNKLVPVVFGYSQYLRFHYIQRTNKMERPYVLDDDIPHYGLNDDQAYAMNHTDFQSLGCKLTKKFNIRMFTAKMLETEKNLIKIDFCPNMWLNPL